jgi:DNA-binding MarR family transcriptional regulator
MVYATPPARPGPEPPCAADPLELLELLALCARRARAWQARALADLGLGESQLSVLWACGQAPQAGYSQIELAAALALSQAQVSVVVEALAEAGLMQSHRSPLDRRRQQWRLTERGVQAWQSACQRLACETASNGGDLSGTHGLLESLRRLDAALRGGPVVPWCSHTAGRAEVTHAA